MRLFGDSISLLAEGSFGAGLFRIDKTKIMDFLLSEKIFLGLFLFFYICPLECKR